MKKGIVYSFACFLVLSTGVFAQNMENSESLNKDSWTKVDLHRTIRLENESELLEVLIDIKNNVQRLELWINSSVTYGKLTIEVYDPDGTKRGNYSIGNQMGLEIQETANGNIRKSLFEPQPGDWKVKVIPNEATGTIKFSTAIREY
jgi:CRISPR/Cas system CSM-associated protein Csm3 (group 7 of RAMP superfamily)